MKQHNSGFCFGLFQKKAKQGRVGRDEDMELTGVLKNSKVDFLGLIKNNVEFPGVMVLGLSLSEDCNTILWNFQW